MFILYAIPIGIVLGFVLGGRPAGLASVQFKWGALAIGGLLVQVILFSAPVTERIGDAGPPLYVVSTAAVLVAVLRNVRIPGMPLVALGAGCNLLAIVANGGFMPASPAATAAIGRGAIETYSNSVVSEAPAFELLTDVIALPAWLPFTNIVSIGDLLIGLGIVIIIALAMRTARPERPVSPGNSPI
jgi:hypothetical protein